MIRARGLVVELGGRRVLDGVDLDLSRGEILGLIGPPESGKTVLLKTLAGLLQAKQGELEHGAASLAEWQSRIGMSFQNDALFDALTVFENVAFPLRRRRLLSDEIDRRVFERLDEVGVRDAAQKLPSELSGGMRKRVGIARATVIAPSVGLFDDPIAGLDPVTGGRILELITGRRDMATIIVSNDLPVLLPVCSRVVMLVAGRVVYDGQPSGLLRSDRPEVVQFATGSDSGPL